MKPVLVDSNVLLDVLTADPTWYAWSANQLATLGNQYQLAINPLIYAEISVGFSTIEALEAVIQPTHLLKLPLPWEASFLAAKAFVNYRRQGGLKRSTLPDFYIGAHAAVEDMTLLTRDTRRYRSYFPSLTLVSPEAQPA